MCYLQIIIYLFYLFIYSHGCDVKMLCFSHANHASTNLKKVLRWKLNKIFKILHKFLLMNSPEFTHQNLDQSETRLVLEHNQTRDQNLDQAKSTSLKLYKFFVISQTNEIQDLYIASIGGL